MFEGKRDWIIVCLFFVLLGLFYAGPNFIAHMNNAIPYSPYGDGFVHMAPGDSFEQFYRYSLFHDNLIRGRWPYYSGYQYSFYPESNFSEAMPFFPFSLICGIMAFFTGNILAYNLMTILSFVFTGFFMYLLILELTRNRAAALIAAVFFTAIPFRTSFLFGEMCFGQDMALLPLPFLFTELGLRTYKKRYYLLFGLSLFLLLTSNSQLFFFFCLLLSPYFIYKAYLFINDSEHTQKEKGVRIQYAIIGILCTLGYLLVLYYIMSRSGLSGGQNYGELMNYAPDVKNMFARYNGNEKNLYLGLTTILVIPIIIIGAWKDNKFLNGNERNLLFLFIPLTLLSYLLCFGPTIDQHVGLPIYKLLFKVVPVLNATRTTGRMMGIAGFTYAILLGIFVKMIFECLKHSNWKFEKTAIILSSIVLCSVIVGDFHYTQPTMVSLEDHNRVYQYMKGKSGKVLGIPFQMEADHYYNSTFMYYALKYDLKMFNGHSSMYPTEYHKIYPLLAGINHGDVDKQAYTWLRQNNYKYVTVHNTDYEPTVSIFVVTKLMNSPYLKYIKSDKGVYLYQINNSPKIEHTATFTKYEDFQRDYKMVHSLSKSHENTGEIEYLQGWYSREVYAGQKPFRWMHRNDANTAYLIPSDAKPMFVEFNIMSPLTEPVSVALNGQVKYNQIIAAGTWMPVKLDVSSIKEPYIFLEFHSDKVYSVETDSREFGCMVSDISIIN